jgi:dTDP-4-dehydrorhamnose reductase
VVAQTVLIGADGMLGRAFREELTRRGAGFTPLALPQLDLTKPETLERGITPAARLVINCAAWTNVDLAEAEEAAATAVNGYGVESLARHCRAVGAMLVTYSTDYVFDGRAKGPYRTDQARAPLNAYGRSKAVGEELLERSGARYLNIRTSWLYAPWGVNFVRTIARLLREKPSIKVVDDQRGRPTSAEHLARTTLALIDKGASVGGECTWCEFAREIGRLTGAPGKVEPCTSAEFPRPAKRPAYSVLDLSRTEALLGPMPDWKVNLAQVTGRLE